MKKLFLTLLLLRSLGAAAPVINNATAYIEHITHASARINYQITSGAPQYGRLRYTTDGSSCTSGAGGALQTTEAWGAMSVNSGNNQGYYSQIVRKLTPATNYNLCPEVSADNSAWSTGGPQFTITTDALPVPHAQLPQAPATFNTASPGAGSSPTLVTLAADCSNLTNAIMTALSQQAGAGVLEIDVTAGSSCTGSVKPHTLSVDAVALLASNSPFNTTNGNITSAAHGLTEGQTIVWAATNGYVVTGSYNNYAPGVLPSAAILNQNLVTNVPVYVHVVDANTFQVYLNSPYGAASCQTGHDLGTPCPVLWKPTNQGSGAILYAKWPRALKTIVIRTSTPDAVFVPEHVRVNPSWVSKMATIYSPNSALGALTGSGANFNFDGWADSSYNFFNANVRLEGLEFTYQPYPLAAFLQDPPFGAQLLGANSDNSNFVIDRCYLHGYPSPFRVYRLFDWNGANVAVVDSYFNNMQMPRQYNFGLVLTSANNTFTVSSGSTRWGNYTPALGANTTVTLSGSPSAQSRVFNYFDQTNTLQIALPPGVTGACSPSPCHVFTADAGGGARDSSNNLSGSFFYIDPILNTTSSPTGATSLFAANLDPVSGTSYTTNGTGGMRFKANVTGYAVGIRFYRMPGAPTATATGSITDDLGTSTLAAVTFSSLSASGWQTAYFSSPVALTAGAIYQARLTGDIAFTNGIVRNQSFQNSIAESIAWYANTSFSGTYSGTCDPRDPWPRLPDGLGGSAVAAGIVGCADVNSSGAITSVTKPMEFDVTGYDNMLGFTNYGSNIREGCQCMIGGVGPGPYAFLNTFVEGVGNVWHHDDSGGLSPRANYYYKRGVFRWPLFALLGHPGSDGFRYYGRQLWETKGGRIIHLEGLLFENAWNDVTGSSLMLAANDYNTGTADFDVVNNEFRHGPGLTNLGLTHDTAPISTRMAFRNNLVWDIGSYQAGAYEGQESGRGWLFEYPSGEDLTIDHNSFLAVNGSFGNFLHFIAGTQPEGLTVTNNLIPISNAGPFNAHGIGADGIAASSGGEGIITNTGAAPWLNWRFDHNLLYPSQFNVTDTTGNGRPNTSFVNSGAVFQSTETQASAQSFYPTLKNSNYIPAVTSFTQLGFFAAPATPTTNDGFYSGLNARAVSNSLASSGNHALYPATDAKDLGADIQAIRDAQGRVEGVTVPVGVLTPSMATITFNAPDAQACPVDYKVYDPTDLTVLTGFTRQADSGTGRARAVTLTGLTTKTTYSYRINCAAEQPSGQFRTK